MPVSYSIFLLISHTVSDDLALNVSLLVGYLHTQPFHLNTNYTEDRSVCMCVCMQLHTYICMYACTRKPDIN